MTTTEVPVETTPDPAAVEQCLGRLTADMGGTLGLLLTSLGTPHGLWRALAGARAVHRGPGGGRVTVDRALVRERLRGQAAAGNLDWCPSPTGRWRWLTPVATRRRSPPRCSGRP